MITVLRRWFVPADKLDEFTERWRNEIFAEIRTQPGCMRVELYQSSIRDHWVLSVTWKDNASREKALRRLAPLQLQFLQYERFTPEVLTLRAKSESGNNE